jgi:abortive infection bacteriophage resistance protein
VSTVLYCLAMCSYELGLEEAALEYIREALVLEPATFGLLSKLFKNLKKCDKDALGVKYYSGVKGDYLASWLHTIGNLRNICAHYGRIYNRNFPIAPKLFSRDKKVGIDNYKVFATILNIKYLIHDKTYWNSWVERLNALVDEYTEIDKGLIGFPNNWYDSLKK